MLPVLDVLSVFVVIGVDAWGEKGFGLPDKLPACPVFVEAGDAEKAWHLLKDSFTKKSTHQTCRGGVRESRDPIWDFTRAPEPHNWVERAGLAVHLQAEGSLPTLNPYSPMGRRPPSYSLKHKALRQIG